MKDNFANRKFRYFILFITFVLFIIFGYGAMEGQKKMSNRVIDWLPSGFQETKDLYWYYSHFHEGELLMVSWENCSPSDPVLEKIAKILTTPQDSTRPALFQRVITTSGIFKDMTSRPLDLTEEEAFARMQGWIISKDHKHGCFVAIISEEGIKDSKRSIDFVYKTVQETTGLSKNQIKMAGPSLDSVVIDETSLQSQQTILPFFLLISILLLFVLLRQWLAVFVVFAAAIFNQQMSTAFVYYTGTHLDTITLLTSSLVFVLTISGSLHLLNYYKDHMETKGKKGAVMSAIKCAALPCTLACLTTIMGLYSLTSSSIIPIKNFGIFSSFSLFFGTVFFFVFIGSILEEFPIKRWSVNNISEEEKKPNKIKSALDWCMSLLSKSIDGLWKTLPKFVRHYRIHILLVSFYALFMTAYYLPRLDTTITFHGMFKKDAPVIQNYDFLENHFGGLVPVEIVVSIPKKDNAGITWLNQLDLLDQIDRKVWDMPETDCTLSALTFIPYLPDPQARGARAVSERSVFEKMMDNQADQLKKSCLFDNQDLKEDQIYGAVPAYRWRISLRVCANKQIVYGEFLPKLQKELDKTIAEGGKSTGIKGADLLITGGIPVVHKAQGQLLKDLCSSYISAFLLILISIIIFFSGPLQGSMAMIPNIFPSIIMFGAMAMLKIPVDMGTMMTASVALGISVDGTIHFLTWFKRGLREGMTQNDAIEYAYSRCGTAMMQATILCGGGMLIFALSSFLPISRFSWILALLLTIALYGDIILFPAMLYGWTGRLFFPKEIKEELRKRKKLAEKKAESNNSQSNKNEVHIKKA